MKLIGGLLFGLWIFAILRMPNKLQRICIEAFKGRKSYGAAGLEGMWGPAFRLGAIVVAGLLVFSLLCLMPKKPVFGRFGRNTLGHYALHPMFITLGFTVFSGHDILMNAFPKLWMPALMLIAFLTTWILSADPLEKGIEKFLGA